MEEVVLVVHLILALAIIGLVLLQRSEGGGLGIGNSGGIGNFASAKGTASALSRMTAICATCFFITSLALGILAAQKTSSNEGLLSAYEETAEAPTEEVEGEISAPVEGSSPKVEIEFNPPETSTPTQKLPTEAPVEAPVAMPSDTTETESAPVEETEPQAGEETTGQSEAASPQVTEQEQAQEPDTKTDSTD